MARTKSESELALSVDRVKELMSYDPATGHFTYITGQNKGRRAGTKHSAGYVQLCIDGRFYRAHRVAWFYMNGVWPDELLDHKNCVKSDNRLTNLREATEVQNHHNAKIRSHNRVGLKGVQRETSSRFSARITIDGKIRRIGSFPDPHSAHAAYCRAAERHFGEFANGGVSCL